VAHASIGVGEFRARTKGAWLARATLPVRLQLYVESHGSWIRTRQWSRSTSPRKGKVGTQHAKSVSPVVFLLFSIRDSQISVDIDACKLKIAVGSLDPPRVWCGGSLRAALIPIWFCPVRQCCGDCFRCWLPLRGSITDCKKARLWPPPVKS